jgi:hypothetical protein
MRFAVSRAPGAERVVTPLELFFNLIYVFAVGQLSSHLLEHVDLRTVAETAVIQTERQRARGSARASPPTRRPLRERRFLR